MDIRSGKAWHWAAVSAMILAASMSVAYFLGVRFAWNSLGFFWQYLDQDLLKSDLSRSLYNLHSQPPLFNLYLGVCSKLGGSSPALVFAASFWVMGFLLLQIMSGTMAGLGVKPKLVIFGVTALALHPSFMTYANWLFYTLPVALLLAAAGLSLVNYMDRGKGWAHAFWWFCGGACLTRATYQWEWMVLAALLLYPVVKLSKGSARAFIVASILPILLLNAWCLKNYTQVGMYNTSSWYGMNLARGWSMTPEEAAGMQEKAGISGVWFLGPFRRAEDYGAYGYFDRFSGLGLHPADGKPYKDNGEPNYNHREYARLSKDMLGGDLAAIRLFPHKYLKRVVDSYLIFTQPGPNSTHFLVKYDFKGIKAWKDITTKFLFLGKPYLGYEGGTPPITLLALVYPLLLGVALLLPIQTLMRGYKGRAVGSRSMTLGQCAFLLFSGFTAIWGMVCSVLVEIGENDRMRWETDPLTLAAFYVIVTFLMQSRIRSAAENSPVVINR